GDLQLWPPPPGTVPVVDVDRAGVVGEVIVAERTDCGRVGLKIDGEAEVVPNAQVRGRELGGLLPMSVSVVAEDVHGAGIQADLVVRGRADEDGVVPDRQRLAESVLAQRIARSQLLHVFPLARTISAIDVGRAG